MRDAAGRELARELADAREALSEMVPGLGGLESARAYSDLTDATIRRIFELAVPAGEAGRVAVAAVGGYGRREMAPHSDVDVAFIVGGEEDEALDMSIKHAFRLLMEAIEGAGLKVGYSYRRVDDIDDLPLETQTALLDARAIAGDPLLFSLFRTALRRAIVPMAFVSGHIAARNGGTVFDIEPNLKEGPGGLRDLHAIRWLSEIAFGIPGERVWETLRSRGVVSDEEMGGCKEAAEFLWRTRSSLHLLAGRPLDILTPARADEISGALGVDGGQALTAVYYAHAQNLRRVYLRVADASLHAELPIEPGIVSRSGNLVVLDRGLLSRDPSSLVRLFAHAQSYRLRIAPDTANLISENPGSFHLSPEAGYAFIDILASAGAGGALRAMMDYGLLQSVVPQFDELMYLVPDDAAHRFTVGEHCLRTVEELERLFEDGGEQLTDIFSRVQHLEVLFLAALLHDIGKLDTARDHPKTGAFRAVTVARALGFSDEATAKVEFLVLNHLKMSEVARLRDLHQRRTIRDFAVGVADLQLLDMLLLLTIADSRAVGTKNWSEVHVRFLLELHERTASVLRHPDLATADIERHRSRVRRELCLANLPAEEVDEHCQSVPASYLLNTPPDELAAHIGYVRTARDGTPVVELKDDRAGHFTLLTVVALDKPGLLSEIAGVLHGLGVDIHAAQIFTRHSSDEIAIDTLYVDFEGRQLSEMKKWELEGELLTVLGGSCALDAFLANRGRGEFVPAGQMHLRVLDNLSDHQTVVEVRTTDSPGLLHYLTQKISAQALNIHSARIATWGHEARDVFYLTTGSGGKLSVPDLDSLASALRIETTASAAASPTR